MLTQSWGALLILQAGRRPPERNVDLFVCFFIAVFSPSVMFAAEQLINVSSSSTNAEQEQKLSGNVREPSTCGGQRETVEGRLVYQSSSILEVQKLHAKESFKRESAASGPTPAFGLLRRWARTGTVRIISSEGTNSSGRILIAAGR